MKHYAWRRIRSSLILMTIMWPLAVGLAAAARAEGEAAAGIDARPIECWWKTDKTGVHVAEQFRLTLTCRIVQSSGVSVVPAFSLLEPGAIQLAPFEVLGGVRHADIDTGIWRYFQYQYTLRLIVEDAFGEDIPIPPLSVAYTIQMQRGGAAQQGRERTHVLPQLPIRMLSLVPALTQDIRDVSRETFADIAAREKRALQASVAGIVLFSFAAVCSMLAAAKLLSGYRSRRPLAARLCPTGWIVHGSLGELRKVRAATARFGWNAESLGTALAACRVAAAIAMKKPVAQALAGAGAVPRDGQLLLRRNLLTHQRVLVSAAATPRAIERSIAVPAAHRSLSRAALLLPQIRDALVVFSDARYGRREELDAETLQRSLALAIEAMQRLQLGMLAPAWTANAERRAGSNPGAVAWSR